MGTALRRTLLSEIQVEAEQMFKFSNPFAEIYAKRTGRPLDVVQNDLERDTFMSKYEKPLKKYEKSLKEEY